MIRLYIGFCVTALLWWSHSSPAAELTEPDLRFFETRIRPVLVQHCYECHSAGAKNLRGGLLLDSRDGLTMGGDSGPAVAPGDPEESLIIQALQYDVLEMPPQGKLPDHVIADFIRWVRMGVPDPRVGTAITKKKPREIDLEEGRKFWSFRPVQPVELPRVQNASWTDQPADRFILSSLEAAGLTPSEAADHLTLVRRAYFTLIGLPPAPDQIQTLAHDKSPDAWERLLDRLLASHHFGERWGRHWLDVARFAESSGGGRSLMFQNAWRFRDYVIRSFNDDKPFDQFAQEQMAGDLLPRHVDLARLQDQLTATGFLALGAINYELQDKELLRMEVIDEQIDTIGRAFLGMTIGCARCHDHKFDPIPTMDYYALAGILRSTQSLVPGNVSNYVERPLPLDGPTELELRRHEEAVAAIDQRIDSAKKELASLKRGLANGGRQELTALCGLAVDNRDARLAGSWQHSSNVAPYLGEGYLYASPNSQASARYEFAVKQSGNYEVRYAYTPHSNRASNAHVVVYHAHGDSAVRVNQRQTPKYDGLFVSLGKFAFETGQPAAVEVTTVGSDGVVVTDAVQLIPLEANESTTTGQCDEQTPESSLTRRMTMTSSEIKRLEAERESLRKNGPPSRPLVMSVREHEQIGDYHVCIRGDAHNLGQRVPRGVLRVALASDDKFLIASGASGRLELAQWLTSSKNPLTPRVVVNRIWHYLFGEGIVRTPDNFGLTGQAPTHPELLDHLADRFTSDGWSVKRTIRRLMLSSTYRLSSNIDSTAVTTDPDNRLFSHFNRQRLESESIRDAMLAISGQLDRNAGGLTIRKISQYDLDYEFDTVRRSVYVPCFRNSRLDLFDVFDTANPNITSGRRTVSTLPTQALYMMNSPFVMQQARHTAAHLLAMDQLTDPQRIDRAYLLTLGRQPTGDEMKLMLNYVTEFAAENRLAAWAGAVHLLFASVEFRYLE